MSKKIFISHAVKDKPIVDAFVDLIQTGANVPYNDIFCSSLEGLGIPAGANFIDHIKSEIQSPELVVAIISKHYLSSQFCMCELGASWAMSLNMYPIIVPPLEFSDVQGVLKATHVVRLDDESGLSQFASEVDSLLPSTKLEIARWNVKQRKFLKSLPKLLKKVGVPKVISQADYDSLREELDATREALDESDERKAELEEMVEKLKECKDSGEVAAVEREFSSDEEELNGLIEDVSSRLEEFSAAISYVAYRKFAFGESTHIDYYKDQYALDDANSGVESRYLDKDEIGFALNGSHPKLRKLERAIQALEEYIENEAPPALHDMYESEHEIPLSITNREFWEFALDSRLSRVYA